MLGLIFKNASSNSTPRRPLNVCYILDEDILMLEMSYQFGYLKGNESDDVTNTW